MSPQPRFTKVSVFKRSGEQVAHFRDERSGRDLYIVLREGRYRHWDRDHPVESEELRTAVAEVLRQTTTPRPRPVPRCVRSYPKPVAKPPPPVQVQGRRAKITAPSREPRDCRKCSAAFQPKGPYSKVCPACKAEAGRAQTAWAGEAS